MKLICYIIFGNLFFIIYIFIGFGCLYCSWVLFTLFLVTVWLATLGFILNKKSEDLLLNFWTINKRLRKLRLKESAIILVWIGHMHPQKKKKTSMKKMIICFPSGFFMISPLSITWLKLIIGDFNAKVGNDITPRPSVHTANLHSESSDNGERLFNFAFLEDFGNREHNISW